MFYIFAVHPVCSTSGPLHNDSNPTGLLCQLPNWYASYTIQLYLPSSSCCKGYITSLSTIWQGIITQRTWIFIIMVVKI
jgi:hypothetical protein